MNTDQVCHMIDTITDGQPYTYTIKEQAGEHAEVVSSLTDIMIWTGAARQVTIDDPRQAEEIAGLLVAWAKAKRKRLS